MELKTDGTSLEFSETQERRFNEALRLRDEGRLEEGIELLAALAVEHPKSGAVWGILGSLLKFSGRREEALEATRNAVVCSPRSELASVGLFHLLIDSELIHEAWRERERFLAICPEAEEYRLLDEELKEGGIAIGDEFSLSNHDSNGRN